MGGGGAPDTGVIPEENEDGEAIKNDGEIG